VAHLKNIVWHGLSASGGTEYYDLSGPAYELFADGRAFVGLAPLKNIRWLRLLTDTGAD